MNTFTNGPHIQALEGPPLPAGLPTTAADDLERARAYLDTGLVLEAGEIFEGLLESGEMPEARLGLARCAYVRRELHAALGHLQALQQNCPNHPGLSNDLGVIYYALGLVAAAHEQLRKAAEAAVDDPGTWHNLIHVAREIGDKDACADYCERLLAICPEDTDVRDLLDGLR